uniref:Uncharacterized protein n=1 Tax=Xiphophorus couchianus TaxID=32473 RepID=A0A3B5L189_9TELE
MQKKLDHLPFCFLVHRHTDTLKLLLVNFGLHTFFFQILSILLMYSLPNVENSKQVGGGIRALIQRRKGKMLWVP